MGGASNAVSAKAVDGNAASNVTTGISAGGVPPGERGVATGIDWAKISAGETCGGSAQLSKVTADSGTLMPPGASALAEKWNETSYVPRGPSGPLSTPVRCPWYVSAACANSGHAHSDARHAIRPNAQRRDHCTSGHCDA